MYDAIRNILVHEQSAIGWDNALKGLLGKPWLDLASMEYDSTTTLQIDGTNRIRQCLAALFLFPRLMAFPKLRAP